MKRVFIVIFILLLAPAVIAEESMSKEDHNTLIGAGAFMLSSIYKDVDNTVLPIPIIVWRNDYFFVKGAKAGVILHETDESRVNVYTAPRFMGYDDEDSTTLSGMSERDMSMDIGIEAAWAVADLEGVTLTAGFAGDMLSEHEGYESKLTLSKKFEKDIYVLIPSIGLKWQSEDMTNYYYGVSSSEATATRSEYNAEDTVNYFIDCNFNLGLSQDWILVTVFNAEFIGNNISNSPIVDDDVILSGVLGLARRF